jgi:hypothetical protein
MTSNYKQGKSDMMNEINRRETEIKSDKWIWWLLAITFIYFSLHIGVALAQVVSPTMPPPVIQCWNNGFGTIQCAPI